MENMFRLSNGQATTKRLKTDAEEYKVSANDCLTLHLFDPVVQNTSWPPKSVCSFKPEFTHQIFGDDEQIVGYKGLAIDVYFSRRDFRACIDIIFTDKAHGAIDIFSTLQEHFPAGLTNDKQQFLSEVTDTAKEASLVKDLGKVLVAPNLKDSPRIIQATLAQGSRSIKVSSL